MFTRSASGPECRRRRRHDEDGTDRKKGAAIRTAASSESTLYVAGASVLPAWVGPPTLTIVALARRLGRHLASRACRLRWEAGSPGISRLESAPFRLRWTSLRRTCAGTGSMRWASRLLGERVGLVFAIQRSGAARSADDCRVTRPVARRPERAAPGSHRTSCAENVPSPVRGSARLFGSPSSWSRRRGKLAASGYHSCVVDAD